MVLCHGFVHGDPHAGNVHVRANPVGGAAQVTSL
jgi:predicted unusual protein kinase regulating ubiquinone biosynthesis (AarF/ABC1/UbiB family)